LLARDDLNFTHKNIIVLWNLYRLHELQFKRTPCHSSSSGRKLSITGQTVSRNRCNAYRKTTHSPKILSQKKLLNEQNIHDYDEQLENIRKKALLAQTNYELLGLEGNGSKIYFQAIFSEMGWVRRCPQAKEDIINLLLDIGYSFIFHFCDSLLRLFGFDTYKGYYHQLFFERKSLSCDIVEPMRTIIDRQLVKSWHLGQIKQKDFIFKNGEFMFKDGFSASRIYSRIFFDSILKQKEPIYLFIQGFYRFILDPMKYPFPVFTPA
jgi:CRISPR-associated protein Cas1